jgi:hypothetical protein
MAATRSAAVAGSVGDGDGEGVGVEVGVDVVEGEGFATAAGAHAAHENAVAAMRAATKPARVSLTLSA